MRQVTRRFARALGSAERGAIRFTLLACLVALALGAAACGDEEPGVDEPAREGLALPLEGVDYNVFITRQLNPAIPPDDTYVEGPEPAPDETLYGVFVQVCNTSDEARGTVENFKVVDSQGNEFEPEELPEDNAFAYHARELDPKECIPEAGSVAQLGPSAGSMLLFKLPLQVTENRPLELEIEGEGDEHLTFELDI
jgi:hypothetical protein